MTDHADGSHPVRVECHICRRLFANFLALKIHRIFDDCMKEDG